MEHKVRRRRTTSTYQREIRMLTMLGLIAVVMIAFGIFWKINH